MEAVRNPHRQVHRRHRLQRASVEHQPVTAIGGAVVDESHEDSLVLFGVAPGRDE